MLHVTRVSFLFFRFPLQKLVKTFKIVNIYFNLQVVFFSDVLLDLLLLIPKVIKVIIFLYPLYLLRRTQMTPQIITCDCLILRMFFLTCLDRPLLVKKGFATIRTSHRRRHRSSIRRSSDRRDCDWSWRRRDWSESRI